MDVAVNMYFNKKVKKRSVSYWCESRPCLPQQTRLHLGLLLHVYPGCGTLGLPWGLVYQQNKGLQSWMWLKTSTFWSSAKHLHATCVVSCFSKKDSLGSHGLRTCALFIHSFCFCRIYTYALLYFSACVRVLNRKHGTGVIWNWSLQREPLNLLLSCTLNVFISPLIAVLL